MEKFLRGTEERLRRIASQIDRLAEAGADPSHETELARELHTLKGEARLMGFVAISRVAHTQEALLPVARAGRFAPDDPATSWFRDGLELTRGLLERAPEDPDAARAAATYIEEAPLASGTSPPPPAPPQPATSFPTATPAGEKSPPPPNPPSGFEKVITTRRGPGVSAVRVDVTRLDLLSRTTDEARLALGALARELDTLGRIEAEAEQVLRDLDRVVGAAGALSSPSEETTWRHEIASVRNRQALVRRRLEETRGAIREAVDDGRAGFDGLQSSLQRVRLVPLSSLFDAYPLAVRELSREQGKSLALEVEGADIEVDAAVLERLEEPVLHLIRNAIDHGIETPRERVAAGKPECARLELRASQRSGQVRIVIRDDGRGLDREAVLRAAVAAGLVGAEEAASLSSARVHALSFASGLSTREAATEVSGRGLGLDIVKRRIEALGGSVSLSSRPGRGTTFTLAAPASVTRIPVMMVGVSSSVFGIPSLDVEGVANLPPGAMRREGTRPYVRVHDENWPVLELPGLVPRDPDRASVPVVLIRDEARCAALRVNRLLGEEPLVVRRLPLFVSEVIGTSGTALSRDGRLVVLLDARAWLRQAPGGRPSAETEALADVGPSDTTVRILVVDDSELTRDMLVRLIEDAGYEVTEAVDGRDALERVRVRPPDLILTDLEMPVMDGFELLEAVRAEPGGRTLPVVVCSTRGSEADKLRAADLGADAYVVKAQFSGASLLDTLARCVGGGGRRERPGS
ncbi:MAG: response regulator [Myxococcota bacterium]